MAQPAYGNSLNSTPDAFFADARARFESAAVATGVVESRFKVAGRLLRLLFAGSALQDRLTPAIRHLATLDDGDAELTVHLFDAASTGIGLRAGWDPSAFRPRGEIVGYSTRRYRTAFQQGADVFLMLDRERREAVYWVADADQVPYWERSFPLRTMIHWWFEDLPLQPMHAAAVGLPDGGVIITGRGGSGKSTTSLACLDSELLYAGDDYVLVQHAPTPYVHCLYSTAKLEADNLERFPGVRPFLDNAERLDREKALVFLDAWRPGRLYPGFPIRAALTLRITGLTDTVLRPSNAMAVATALAPTTLYHLSGGEARTFAKIAALLRQLPCYVLELGTDLPQIPARILEFLRGQPVQ